MVPQAEMISAGFLVKDKKVFVAQRSDGMPDPLKWEFPGGKLGDDEKYDDALIREFNEEFGIKITVDKEIGSAEVDSKKILVILFFLVSGDPDKITLKVHKQSKLVSFAELKTLDLCEADKIFIKNYENELKQYID